MRWMITTSVMVMFVLASSGAGQGLAPAMAIPVVLMTDTGFLVAGGTLITLGMLQSAGKLEALTGTLGNTIKVDAQKLEKALNEAGSKFHKTIQANHKTTTIKDMKPGERMRIETWGDGKVRYTKEVKGNDGKWHREYMCQGKKGVKTECFTFGKEGKVHEGVAHKDGVKDIFSVWTPNKKPVSLTAFRAGEYSMYHAN